MERITSVTRVHNGGARGPGLIRLTSPLSIFHIAPFILHCVPASKDKYSFKIKDEGANSDEYQTLFMYSWHGIGVQKEQFGGLNKDFLQNKSSSGLQAGLHTTDNCR